MKKFFTTILITLSVLCFANFASALGAGGSGLGAGKTATQTQLNATSSQLHLSIKLDNPIADTDIMGLIERVIGVVLKIGIPVIALFLLWAGFKYITARGNKTELETAHRNLGHVLLGTAIFLGAYSLALIIIDLVKSITS